MALPQYLIDQGYEEAPDNVSDRDASRRTSNINGYNVYFLDSQETFYYLDDDDTSFCPPEIKKIFLLCI